MANEDERRLILDMIESGKITAEEGLHLLHTLPESEAGEDEQGYDARLPGISDEVPAASVSPEEDAGPVLVGDVEPAARPPDFDRWRSTWMIPLWIGVGVTVLGSLLMFWAQQSTGVSFLFFCAGLPFALGVVLIVLAWQSRTARWLHLRVQQRQGEWPKNIAFSFPLPIRAASWFMHTFGRRIPGMENTSVDEVLRALESSTSADDPLFLEVEEGEDGERVQIFIG